MRPKPGTMPELPEVESVRQGLARARITGPITELWRSELNLRTGEYWRRERESLERLMGAMPGPVRRRGKYLIWHFSRAEKEMGLVIHLGMSGRCGIVQASAPSAKHTHLRVCFADGRELRFVDPRRFGGLRAGSLPGLYEDGPLSRLGPEPLASGFDGSVLMGSLGRSTRGLRDALLDQRAVAGIGNIYAVEALFEAKLHPLLACDRLAQSAWQRLADALQRVLRRSIKNGGTTLKDFRKVDGEVGRNQEDLRVYGRAQQPCPCCSTALVAFVSAGRSGARCKLCQKMSRSRRVL